MQMSCKFRTALTSQHLELWHRTKIIHHSYLVGIAVYGPRILFGPGVTVLNIDGIYKMKVGI
jgi:hypothetical protein